MVLEDIASSIARNWHQGLKIEYGNVDFGKCVEYDVLQIINRIILEAKAQKNEPSSSPDNQQS